MSAATLPQQGKLGVQASGRHLRADDPVCRAEGLAAQARIRVTCAGRSIIATLHHVAGDALLSSGDAGLSDRARLLLGAADGAVASIDHAPVLDSLSHVRAKAYGRRIDAAGYVAIVRDIADGAYADVHLASFVTACANNNLDRDETVGRRPPGPSTWLH